VDADPAHALGVGLSWARVVPGGRSDPHQHDETEVFVVARGHGEIVVDGRREPLVVGTVAIFEPFETHVVENTGDVDLVFADLYWRDAAWAGQQAARRVGRRRLDERPLFVFSTPPTPNGDLHLGHLSGPYLGADVFVRFQRMNGATAWHLTGSDDYQSYVADLAARTGQEPSAVAAHYSAEILETLRLMDIPIDQYTVTDVEPGYRAGLQRFFSSLVASGRVAPRRTPALTDADGRYLYEVDVSGGCPGCGRGTNGNICEECGEPNVCADLDGPTVKRSGKPAHRTEVERFTLPLHEFAREVAAHHRQGRVPARLRELARRVLYREHFDLPITHPSGWGVPPAADDATGTAVHDQVIWVWPEMAYGFLHGIEALGCRLGTGWRAEAPENDWKIIHFFGYDNSFYHSILYPVLYRLAHPDWKASVDYHVNEFYLLEGSKFSTSRRHAVWGKEVLSPATVDAIRYHLCLTRPEAERTNYRQTDFDATVADTLVGRWQAWLAGIAERVAREHDGLVPDAGVWVPEHVAFLDSLRLRLDAMGGALSADGFSLNRAAAHLDAVVADAERFSAEQAHVRDDPEWADENRTTLALELAAAALLARVATPLMPRFAGRLSAALGMEPIDPEWPRQVTLVAPGTRLRLAGVRFFDGDDSARTPATGEVGAAAAATSDVAADPDLTAWCRAQIREILGLGADPADAGLAELGLGSLQVVTLQYQILDTFDVDLPIDDLWSASSPAALGALIASRGAHVPQTVEAGA